MGFLKGKKALIVGLATDRSIAWGISQAMQREGAELAFTYQNDRIKDRVVEHAGELGSKLVMPMDVGIDGEIDAAFARLTSEWGALDVIVHSVAFAPREALTGDFVDEHDPRGVRAGARRVELQPDGARARRPAADDGPRRRAADALLPRRSALDPFLQRDGTRQGEPRGQRALPGGRPRARRASG